MHALTEFKRAVTMNIKIEGRKRCNTVVEYERLKTVSSRRRVDELFDETV